MWKGITSYSKADKERVPTTFTTRTEHLRITVTCGHIAHKGEWVMYCPQLNIECLDLASDSLDEAKASAVHAVKMTIEQFKNEIGSITC